MIPVPDPAFDRLLQLVSDRSGLRVEGYKQRCVRRRVAVRMRARGAETYDEYIACLRREPGELDRLLSTLTINVTRFYRNADTWARLGTAVLPPALTESSGWLRCWSAGCASGEEPFTLAMMVAATLERLGRPEWLPRVSIDATDLDPDALAAAARGRYAAASFAELPPDLTRRYTSELDEGARGPVPAIRGMVRFSGHDLTREPPPGGPYHLILCRNVLIYFDRDMQDHCFATFARGLAPGGVLVLGKVEVIRMPARFGLAVRDAQERIYQRTPE